MRMTPLALRLLTILALFLPAASESARLILVNGGDVRDIAIVSMQVPASGVVVIVPDVIFAARFEPPAAAPDRGSTPEPRVPPRPAHRTPAHGTAPGWTE